MKNTKDGSLQNTTLYQKQREGAVCQCLYFNSNN